jgi:2'-5' RNA ligase
MLPEGIVRSVAKIQKKFVGFGLKCKLVETKNMHICLSFLGEVDEEDLEGLKLKLDEVVKRYERFDVNVGGVKFIPSENYIRVMALEVTDRNGVLERVRRGVVDVIGGSSKPPHLTLCRVKHVDDKRGLVNKFRAMSCNESFQVGSIHLIESKLERSGPMYTVVYESKLH